MTVEQLQQALTRLCNEGFGACPVKTSTMLYPGKEIMGGFVIEKICYMSNLEYNSEATYKGDF